MVKVRYDYNGLNQVLNGIESWMAEQLSYVKKSKTSNIGLYQQLKESSLAEIYADTVDDYYKLCDALSQISSSWIDLRDLRNSISEIPGVTPRIEQTLKARIDRILKDMGTLKESFIFKKEAGDARLKFLNSYQYIITGDKFRDKS